MTKEEKDFKKEGDGRVDSVVKDISITDDKKDVDSVWNKISDKIIGKPIEELDGKERKLLKEQLEQLKERSDLEARLTKNGRWLLKSMESLLESDGNVNVEEWYKVFVDGGLGELKNIQKEGDEPSDEEIRAEIERYIEYIKNNRRFDRGDDPEFE
jgi:hypothetical protein